MSERLLPRFIDFRLADGRDVPETFEEKIQCADALGRSGILMDAKILARAKASTPDPSRYPPHDPERGLPSYVDSHGERVYFKPSKKLLKHMRAVSKAQSASHG